MGGYYGGKPSKGPVNLAYPEYFESARTSVKQGFIPKPHGIIGELVILLCLAHNIAPYGFPLKFEGNIRDELSADTTSFVKHDHAHHHNVYGREFKRNWILSGGLHDLLHKVPNPFEAKEVLQKGIVSFMGGAFLGMNYHLFSSIFPEKIKQKRS